MGLGSPDIPRDKVLRSPLRRFCRDDLSDLSNLSERYLQSFRRFEGVASGLEVPSLLAPHRVPRRQDVSGDLASRDFDFTSSWELQSNPLQVLAISRNELPSPDNVTQPASEADARMGLLSTYSGPPRGLDFSQVVTFNLDEYFPMELGRVHSYHRFIRTNLFDHVNVPESGCHIPWGDIYALEAFVVTKDGMRLEPETVATNSLSVGRPR